MQGRRVELYHLSARSEELFSDVAEKLCMMKDLKVQLTVQTNIKTATPNFTFPFNDLKIIFTDFCKMFVVGLRRMNNLV